jgi:hypothetical protein
MILSVNPGYDGREPVPFNLRRRRTSALAQAVNSARPRCGIMGSADLPVGVWSLDDVNSHV